MQLKRHLRKTLIEKIAVLENTTLQTRNSLDLLKSLKVQNANYVVNLRSLWETDGEKSTRLEYMGRLSDAIIKAGEEFLKTNNRTDIQAEYTVSIKVGNLELEVPKNFYEEFKRVR